MCGIAGVVSGPQLDPARAALVRRMAATMVHRGPDGAGHASLPGCDLGFMRLAIVDPEGDAAPHASEDRSITAVCNGEIYNAAALRGELEARGHRFRTRIDTEVIPHLYEEHGPGFISRLDGMFAFAVWDAPRRRLVLGRDRAGEKPLYWWAGAGEIAFSSELRGLLAHPRVGRDVDPVALRRYLLHDYFPAPLSPLAGAWKLPAAHYLVHDRDGRQVHRYWDLASAYERAEGSDISERRAADELDGLLAQAVRRRKQSDVPVGVFLSGGLDSSGILAHLAAQDGPGVPVFTLGHADPAFDESRHAEATARRFGAECHSLVLAEDDLAEGLRLVGDGFDEPLGDASIIPTHLLARHAARHVKVVLSGEGGDELFAGYPTYLGHRVADLLGRMPAPLRTALVAAARRLAPSSMGNVGLDYLLQRFVSASDREPIERHVSWFGSVAPDLQQRILAPGLLAALEGDDPIGSARAVVRGRKFPDRLAELLCLDFCTYLQDDLLTKVDRATMLASLEARAPLLDHELVEYVAGLPSHLKLRGRQTKAVLRRALAGRVPRDVLRRRKRGFNIPFSRWLLGGLGPQLRERFSKERVEARGLFRPEALAGLLDDHLSRRADLRKPLFNLLALDLWCDRTFGVGAEVPLASAAPRPLAAGARL